MSELVSFSREPVWPTSSTPDANLIYNVSAVGRSGSGVLDVVLTAGAMPEGVTVTFTPSTLRFTGNALTSQTATMTVTCPYTLPLDCFPFTITATSKRETITLTNVVEWTPQLIATRVPTLTWTASQGTGCASEVWAQVLAPIRFRQLPIWQIRFGFRSVRPALMAMAGSPSSPVKPLA